MKFAQNKKFSLLLCCLGLLALSGLASCSTAAKTTPAATTDPVAAPEVAASATRPLVYGINVVIPQGWVVDSSADKGVAEKAEIDSHLAKGERVGILNLFRPKENSTNVANGQIFLALVSRTGNAFLPEADVQGATPADLANFSQAMVERERELAATQKRGSTVLDWKIEKAQVGGNLALVQRGRIKHPEGVAVQFNVDVYLPNNAGLMIRSMADESAPGTEAILRSFVQSITVNK